MREFDEGYAVEPYRTLVRDVPGVDVYPADAFRVEWGPVFHRGRLDGSARVLVIGQDPATHEQVARRILVGEAGQRVQGFLEKLGYDRSYVMLNAFLYGVYGQGNGEKHKNDAGIAAYRERWFEAVLGPKSKIECVIAFGSLARQAWERFLKTSFGKKLDLPFAYMTHPTQPESASKGNAQKLAIELGELLENWNKALKTLKPAVKHPDKDGSFAPYGTTGFAADELVAVPSRDLPAGTPEWMCSLESWAWREADQANGVEKRRRMIVVVPEGVV